VEHSRQLSIKLKGVEVSDETTNLRDVIESAFIGGQWDNDKSMLIGYKKRYG
jgi:hypothetical protein